MKRNSLLIRISGAAVVPVLALALGSGAYAQDRHDDRQYDNRQNDNRDHRNDNRNDNRDAQRYDNRDMHRDNGRSDYRGRDQARDFHFNNQYRDRFAQHYRGDADHWRARRDRVRFDRGQRIPVGYRIQPVPGAYYRDVPPPPPGYQYGYYEGYVVAYDPTTRVIGDVLDLVGAMSH
jgi:Ni/Co efflux regulator RcnB